MVFEKEEPQNLEYAVEVFPEGNENDTKPEPETEEFAVYCRRGRLGAGKQQKETSVFFGKSGKMRFLLLQKERYEMSAKQNENLLKMNFFFPVSARRF